MKSIEAVRKTLPSNELIQIKPFNEYSISIQCKHILDLEKRAKFEVNGCMHIINYRKIDKKSIELQIQAIVKSINRGRISQDAYRSLARLDESLIKAGAIYDMRQEITNRVNKIIPISLVDIDQLASFEPIKHWRGHLKLNENIQNLILAEMKRLRINHFHFWIERSTQSSSYTSLMGPDKFNILENFSFTSFISKKFSQKRANQLRQLWTGFFKLYKMMTLANIAGAEFKIKVKAIFNTVQGTTKLTQFYS
ncbi:hypothetical protein C2G38_2251704 [Gigaspora rosea]|uniref:Uncharacterized protein n=1 Tax=Gigaspora rosea TaxID=44941 RepID=A0A397UI56_9GLOM|nr:hypothetical protein C2G38_2251704 [Gigaspora rosea]